MHEHRTPNGKTMYYMSRAELERLPGHKGHGDTYRSRCPVHGGDSNSAFQINYKTGWGHCFKCGDEWSLRVADHPDTKLPKDHPDYRAADHKRNTPPPTLESLKQERSAHKQQSPPPNAPESPQTGDSPQNDPTHAIGARKRLQAQIPAAMDALPGSSGAAYLEARGIDLQTARALRIGWSTRGDLAHRVILPLTGPDGVPIGATGRAIRDGQNPKYKALAAGKGYRPGLFNGGAISQAIRSDHPLLIVEGPLDAAAAYAAGYPLTVAIGSTSYKHWDHFAGVQRAILLLDNDDAGIGARSRAYAALVEIVPDVQVLKPAALATILEGEKDFGDYWQRYQRMPLILGGIIMGPHIPNRTKPDEKAAIPAPAENDHPMVTGSPHSGSSQNDHPMGANTPHELPVIEPPIEANTPHASDLPTPYPCELTGPVVLELFETLPPALQLEAYELLEQLQGRAFATAFRNDFYNAYAVLETADRVACLWALIYHPADALARWKRGAA